MSTIAATQTKLPTGTWNVDPVHSQVGFAVEYMVGTFRGSFSPVEGTLAVAEDGTAELKGSAQAASVKVQDENLVDAPALARLLRRRARAGDRASPPSDIRRDGDDVTVNGELTIKGITQPVTLDGHDHRPDRGRVRQRPHRPHARDDRSTAPSFGLNWNLPLPNGKPALANDVTLTAELYLVKA